ncbi:hypothetical protein Plhal703r1_c11g0057871 [Plasmopara halstedii]
MTDSRYDFVEYHDLDHSIKIAIANGQRLLATDDDFVRFQVNDIVRVNVLHVPLLNKKLVSIFSIGCAYCGGII